MAQRPQRRERARRSTGADVVLTIDTRELRDLASALHDLPKLLQDTVITRTVNRAGDMGRTAVVKALHQQTEVRSREVAGNVRVVRASPQKPRYELVIQGEWLSGLFFISTMHDERVCELCIRAEQGGPYSENEFFMFYANPHGGGLIHPNCRCRKVPVEQRVREQLQEGGSIATAFHQTVRREAPRIVKAEIQGAFERLRKDYGLRG